MSNKLKLQKRLTLNEDRIQAFDCLERFLEKLENDNIGTDFGIKSGRFLMMYREVFGKPFNKHMDLWKEYCKQNNIKYSRLL